MTFEELLAALGHTPDEHIAICHRHNTTFNTTILRPADAATLITRLPATADIWHQPNPTTGPARTGPRGDATAITRLAALHADLDIKPGGCPNIETAHTIIDTISGLIGEHPTAIVSSGHGLQPYWAIDDGRIDETFTHADAAGLLRRFGRLAAAVAERHNASIDNTFDLARILRTPGTVNNKNPDQPVPTTATAGTGGPLTLAQVRERLDEAGIHTPAAESADHAEPATPPSTWAWAATDCPYAHTMTVAWNTDTPGARHPWLISQAIRLAAAHRRGCLTKSGHTKALRALADRFTVLCATGGTPRNPGACEIADAVNYGKDRAAAMTDAALRAELGQHLHIDELAGGDHQGIAAPAPTTVPATPTLESLECDFWTARPAHQLIYAAAMSAMCSPWAVFAIAAARTLALIPPHIRLPGIIGGPGSLNWYALIVARSGGGKGAATAVAERLIPQQILTRPLGSGEGMIGAYERAAQNAKNPPPPITSVLFFADEIDAMAALGGRAGQTTMSILRQGFSGETLGFSYRNRTAETVPAHTYRMCCTVAAQPSRIGGVIDDGGGGTPQRFMWFFAKDKRISRDRPNWPTDYNGMPMVIPLLSTRQLADAAGMVPVCQQVIDDIETARVDAMTSDDHQFNGHALFAMEKLAVAIAAMDGRIEIGDEDWRLAGIAAAVSDMVKDRTLAQHAAAMGADAHDRGRLRGREQHAAKAEMAVLDAERMERISALACERLRDGPMTAGALRRLFNSRDRPYVGDACAVLHAQGLITIDGHKWRLADGR